MGWGASLYAGLSLALAPLGAAAQSPWGPPGSPIHLNVGYQTYYTEAWSAMVIRDRHFQERYLPAGSTVRWEIGIHGPVILGGLREGRLQIGYLGDQPAANAAAHPELRDLRLIAATGRSFALCNTLLVRIDAPPLPDADAAIGWLGGRRVAASFGGCSDRFAQGLFALGHVKPGNYLNLTPTVLKSAFSGGLIDAAVVQEPVASNLIALGLARRALTGADVGLDSGAFLVAGADLVRERPDVVKAWLEAELDAEQFMSDPRHAEEIIEIATKQTIGYAPSVLRSALYGDGPGFRMTLPFAFTQDARRLLAKSFAFLQANGRAAPGEFRAAAILDGPAAELLEQRHVTPPVGEIRGLP